MEQIAPTAAGSIPFAPEDAECSLYHEDHAGEQCLPRATAVLCVNLTVKIAARVGFDRITWELTGAILFNSRITKTGLIWNLMKKTGYIVAGLKKQV